MNGYFYLLLIWAGDPFGTIKKSLLTSCLFVFSWNTINCIEGLICFSFFKSKEMWEIKAANPGLNRRLRARSVHVHAHGIPSLCRGLALLLSFLSSVFAPNSKFFFRMYQNTALLDSEGNAFFSCSQTSTWKHLHLGRERPCGLKWMPAFKLLALTCCDPDGNGCLGVLDTRNCSHFAEVRWLLLP